MPLNLALTLPPLFYDSGGDLLRVIIVTPVLYVCAILFIRLSGKRSTSQMNNFDWMVTVAMGSMIASPILLDDVVVLEVLLAIGLLLALQFIVTKLSVISEAFEWVVKAPPNALVRDGEFIREAMRAERVTKAEIEAAVREDGLPDVHHAAAVVLESDANLSVLAKESCTGKEREERPAGWTDL